MTAATTTELTDEQQIVALSKSLTVLLREIVAEKAEGRKRPDRLYTTSALVASHKRGDAWIDAPLTESYRLGVTAIGKAIACVGGIAALHEVIDNLPTDLEGMTALVDHAWDQITDGDEAVWLA